MGYDYRPRFSRPQSPYHSSWHWEFPPLAAETLLAEINRHFLLQWSIFRPGNLLRSQKFWNVSKVKLCLLHKSFRENVICISCRTQLTLTINNGCSWSSCHPGTFWTQPLLYKHVHSSQLCFNPYPKSCFNFQSTVQFRMVCRPCVTANLHWHWQYFFLNFGDLLEKLKKSRGDKSFEIVQYHQQWPPNILHCFVCLF